MIGTITCSSCGKQLTMLEAKAGHYCPAKQTMTEDRTTPVIEVASDKHSVIVDGKEYWVDSKKLAILEKLIQL